MKCFKYIYILMLLLNVDLCYGQMLEQSIILSKHILLNTDSIAASSVYAKQIAYNNEYIEIHIINSSADTVYLFSSYFDDNLYQSPFLHRYDKEGEECIISFLPIPYYMAYIRSDLVIIGERRVTSQFQVVYQFECILPNSYLSILVPKDCLNYNCVEDYNPQNMNKWTKPRFKKLDKIKNYLSYKMEFAVYKNVKWFNESEYYDNEYSFDKASKEYNVISVTISD